MVDPDNRLRGIHLDDPAAADQPAPAVSIRIAVLIS